jgi:hypothetical protein
MSVSENLLTDRASLVQSTEKPLFRGQGAERLCCGGCGHTLVDGYDPRALIAIDIECYKCKSRTRTARWPDIEPLPTAMIMLGESGRYALSGTINLADRVAISCPQEVARVKAVNSPRPEEDSNLSLTAESLNSFATELEIWTDGAVGRIEASIERARKAGNLDYATVHAPLVWAFAQVRSALSRRSLNLSGPDQIAISYLQIYQKVKEEWRHHPLFPAIARSFCHDFHHSITTLAIASYLSENGNHVGITDATAHSGKSPDLFVNTARSERLSLEIKCPRSFFWPSDPPDDAELFRRIDKELKGARAQLTGGAGGVVVLGAGHQIASFDAAFRACVRSMVERQRVSRRICAIVSVSFFGASFSGVHAGRPMVSSGATVDVVLNPRFKAPNPIGTTTISL